MKTSWRRLEGDVRLRRQKTSSRRFNQDEYIRLSHASSEDILRRLKYVLVKTNIFVLIIRLQDVFKKFSRRFAKRSSRRPQDVLQKRLQDIFKTSCKDVFKTFSRCIIKLNGSCKYVLEKISTRFWNVLQRQLPTEGRNLWSVYKICKSDKNFSSFSF